MNLEELRNAMASDATIENQKLKEELESLREVYKAEREEKDEQISLLVKDCHALSNRCFVLSKGKLCMFCELSRYRCVYAMSFTERMAAIAKFKKENERES